MFKRSWKKNMGYTRDQKGIISRYIAEAGSWDSHLSHCKQEVIKFLTNQSKKNVLIIGSGWLLDVPMDWLIKHKENIYLIDIHHPEQIKHKYRKYGQVHFIEQDVLGDLSQKVFKVTSQSDLDIVLNTIENHRVELDFSQYHASVVSLNIMNQLDILLLDYLKDKGYNLVKEQEDKIRSNIQLMHLNSLPKAESLVISDIIQISTDDNGQKVKQRHLIFTPLEHLTELNHWQWTFDTHKTYDPNYQTTMMVKALII